MASDTTITFYGCWHLAGETVQLTIAGVDQGDYTVEADGTVVFTFSLAADALITPQYLASLDGADDVNATAIRLYIDDVLQTITVPVVIGKVYTSKGQTLRPALENDLGLRVNGLGKIRRAHQFATLLNFAVAMDYGTDFAGTMDPIVLTQADGETAWPVTDRYTGVYKGTLTDEYGYDSMLCWQVDRPVPAMVCAVSAFLVAENAGEN